MSEAPERIWLGTNGTYSESEQSWTGAEYVRADLVGQGLVGRIRMIQGQRERIEALERERDEARALAITPELRERIRDTILPSQWVTTGSWTNKTNRLLRDILESTK